MSTDDIVRKDLDNQQFMTLRQSTERITQLLDRRLKGHLNTLRPLFVPRKLLGTYVKSAVSDEVPGSDKAFARFQERYAAISDTPLALPKRLQPPLPPISNQLDAVPYKYALHLGSSADKATTITAATRWVVSFRTECPFERLQAMARGTENPQPNDVRQSVINHLTLVLFVEQFPTLKQLLQDLRYEVEVRRIEELGALPVVILKAPLESFLPSDDFILQITQLSGIPAFQEIIDLDAVESMPDPLKQEIKAAISK